MAWPVDQVATGDLISAAQLNALPVGLAEASGAAATYDFQNIPAHWTHLLLVGSITGSSATIAELWCYFNNDTTTARYSTQSIRASTTSITGERTVAYNGFLIARDAISSDGPTAFAVFIPNYASAVPHSTVGITHYAEGGENRIETLGGYYNQSTAISRLTIDGAADFGANSITTLYGMGNL